MSEISFGNNVGSEKQNMNTRMECVDDNSITIFYRVINTEYKAEVDIAKRRVTGCWVRQFSDLNVLTNEYGFLKERAAN
jgi:hypothetical protein